MCKSRFKILNDHRCTKVHGENHHHAVPGRSFIEFNIFCWACKLHTAKHPGKETPGQIVKQLASTWPFPLPGNRQELKKILLNFSRLMKKDPQKAQEFQLRFGSEHLVRFINLLEKQQPYWLVPLLPHKTNGEYTCAFCTFFSCKMVLNHSSLFLYVQVNFQNVPTCPGTVSERKNSSTIRIRLQGHFRAKDFLEHIN